MIQSKRNATFWSVIFLLTALVIGFSCSSEKDARKSVTKDLGQPDQIVKSDFAGTKYEYYVYARRDLNRTYEFRKNAGGCGGSGKWYVYRMYYTNYIFPDIPLYMPPTIVHEQIKTAPPGSKITVNAEVNDDETVVDVTLFYRTTGQEEYQSVRMTIDESGMFTASIPATVVVAAGVQYYIEAWDDEHSSSLPEKSAYTIAITSSVEKPVYGPLRSAPRAVTPPPVTGLTNDLIESAPVSP